MTIPKRRQSDTGRHIVDLDPLFLKTSTELDKEFLLALKNINENLTLNTSATHLVMEQFTEFKVDFEAHKTVVQDHLTAEAAVFNQVKGAKWFLPIVFVLAQSIVIYLWDDMRDDIKLLADMQKMDEREHHTFNIRIDRLEENK